MPIFTIPNHGVRLLESREEIAKRYGIAQFELPSPDSQVKSIGFNPKTKTWYGWSHRAIAGFKVGDVVRKGDVIADGVAADLRGGRNFPVGFTAQSLQDCRDMAAKFSMEVS